MERSGAIKDRDSVDAVLWSDRTLAPPIWKTPLPVSVSNSLTTHTNLEVKSQSVSNSTYDRRDTRGRRGWPGLINRADQKRPKKKQKFYLFINRYRYIPIV